VHADSAAIFAGDSTSHPKSQSAAFFRFGRKEWFKYPFSVLRRNARPIVEAEIAKGETLSLKAMMTRIRKRSGNRTAQAELHVL
jgi:hypothetical protein